MLLALADGRQLLSIDDSTSTGLSLTCEGVPNRGQESTCAGEEAASVDHARLRLVRVAEAACRPESTIFFDAVAKPH